MSGINAKRENRIQGIVDRISSEDDFDSIKWITQAPVQNFCRSAVDEIAQKNAELHNDMGLEAKIVRQTVGENCKWCDALAGEYVYPDVPKEVYQRHDDCDCIVEYHPGDGRKQDVWGKQWTEAPEDLEVRKVANIETEVPTIANQTKRAEELGVNADFGKLEPKVAKAMNDALETALKYDPDLKVSVYGSAQAINKELKAELTRYYVRTLTEQYKDFQTPEQIEKLAKKYASKLVGRVPGDVYAYYRPAQNFGDPELTELFNKYVGVYVNEKVCKNYDAMLESVKRDVELGFHPIGTGNVRSVFDHELGHALDWTKDLHNNTSIRQLYLDTDVSKEVSRYAEKNVREFLAETYAEYINNDEVREVAKNLWSGIL